jgi:hypothetical protein
MATVLMTHGAYGTWPTWFGLRVMSAFGGKRTRLSALAAAAFGVKRTPQISAGSANDPKRRCATLRPLSLDGRRAIRIWGRPDR